MEHLAVKRILTKYSPRLIEALELVGWDITIDTVRLPEGAMGLCSVDPTYHQAVIQIDPETHKTPEEVLDTLIHELCHVATGEVVILRCLVEAATEDETFQKAFQMNFEMVQEWLRERLMGILENLGVSPKKLLGRS